MAEPDIISLDESYEECPQEARFVLVGKILASKVLNKSGVQKIIEKAWRTEEEFSISPWRDNVYAFGFKNEDDLCRIISKSPWSVMGSILILRKWDKKKSFSELDFRFSPFWVQIHGLPLRFLNVKTGSAIAESFGDVIAVEDPSERGRLVNYLRIRVWLDVSKPLKKGFFLRRPKEDDIWVSFKYERLSDFCYGCGKISHRVNECKERCSFVAKDWVYDSGIRAEVAVVDTIQYGDKPLPRLVYPERKKSAVSIDEGGACSEVERERVKQSGQNIPVDDLVVNQGSKGVECAARTNFLGSATLQARSPVVESLSGSSSSSGIPFDCGPHLSVGKEVVGLSLVSKAHVSLEEQTRERAHYFVEEPDSPRRIVINKDPGPVEDTLSRPLQLGYVSRASLVFGLGCSEKAIDEGLTNAFSKSLSLKRKCDYLSGEENGGKRVKRSTSGEIENADRDKGDSVLGRKRFSPTPSRARGRRGRGSRGRSAKRGLSRK
ncbi:uncharacterized protein LOC131298712 [Rhododendron vialii]|uniref:uncharacterized protein LOC131298712 n=1 Tax=Rhododendron vialii TaxID=182163 RepID=UPI00265EC09E|nr:uncharacterized protein LOC131298712 [Rhododendron vialii]